MAKVKKIPLRKCVGCNQQFDKRDLLRVVRNKEGEVFLDPTGRMNGRGAYLCKNRDCLELAIKKKALQRALETSLAEEKLEEIRSCFDAR